MAEFGSTGSRSILSATMASAGAAVSNTTTETSLITGSFVGSKTIPANAMNVAGRTLRVNARGVYSSDVSAHQIDFRVRLGGVSGTILAAAGAQAVAGGLANRGWSLACDITCRRAGGAGVGQLIAQGLAGVSTLTDVSWRDMESTAPATVDLTVANDLEVTAQWGTADPDDSITAHTCTIEILN